MSKKITLCFLVMLMIDQHKINTASSQSFSTEITNEFRNAVLKRDSQRCLAMLDESETVLQINFNQINPINGRSVWIDLMVNQSYDSENMALRILKLRTVNNELVVDINERYPYWGETALVMAINYLQNKFAFKILELKKTGGSLLADINLKDRYNASPLKKAINCWYSATNGFHGYENSKSWCALIIKQLLLFGSDTTNIETGGTFGYLCKTPMQVLAICKIQPHEWILPIFNALRPDLDLNKLTFQEYMVVQAYQEFLQGKHEDLRNQLLVLPYLMRKKGLCRDPFFINLEKLHKVFKPESIKPLLIFLAEKQYQRNFVDELLKPKSDLKDKGK